MSTKESYSQKSVTLESAVKLRQKIQEPLTLGGNFFRGVGVILNKWFGGILVKIVFDCRTSYSWNGRPTASPNCTDERVLETLILCTF